MTLLALLLVGALAAGGTAWALPRGGPAARIAAIGGVAAFALIATLAAVSPTPHAIAADASGAVPGTLWNGALVAGGYLRLAVVLSATTAILMCGLIWLLRGVGGLRGVLPGSLAALVGTTVALGASSPQLGLVAAGATGLASIPVVLASAQAAAPGIAAREVRIAVATALAVLAVASVLPALERLILPGAAVDGASARSGVAATAAFGLLAMTLVIAARVGAIPYHVRISALTDTAPAGSLPLVMAWLPLPLAAVSVGVMAGALAPMALSLGAAQALIVVLVLLATVAAGLVAAYQDDLRHAVGYLTLADLGIVVLAFAALDSAAWGPARTWLLTVAVTKTALLAWATVAEDRFETRSVPDLRGWLRPSPLLGVALVLIVVATYGLPGWAVLNARLELTGLAAGAPWSVLLLAASLLTLPAYARWLWLGVGVPTSHVDGIVPEFLAQWASSGRAGQLLRPPTRRRGREEGLPVEQETEATLLSSSTAPARPNAPSARQPASPDLSPTASRRSLRALGSRAQPRSSSTGAVPDLAIDGPADREARPRPGIASRLRGRPILPSESKPVAETRLWADPETLAPAEPATEPASRMQPKPAGRPRPTIEPTSRAERLAARPRPTTEPELSPEPTLFDLPEPDQPPLGGSPAEPAMGDVRAGTGVGRRSRTPKGSSGSSPMTAPRAPEASKALPSAALAAEGDPEAQLSSSDALTRPRRGRVPAGPDAATRAAAAVRRRRADLLSTAVLALAILATLVAAGAFDISKAACEPTQAVPIVHCN